MIYEEGTHGVTKRYRSERNLSQRAFAEALGEKLVNISITHATVANWENAKTEPETDFLLICVMIYADWRMQFGIDALCAKLPEVFERDASGALATLKSVAV